MVTMPLIVVLFPALLALLALSSARRALAVLLPLAAAPALLAALFAAPMQAHYSALLLGMQLGLDTTGRVFMLFTAVIWTAVGAHLRTGALGVAMPLQRRFLFCYLLAMSGNLGVILAQDSASFYLFFAVLSLAAYGLIVTERGAKSRQAGRLYLILALFGEMLILAAFLLTSAGSGSPLLAPLLYFGLGIKHGVLPMHMWLPLAHGRAPPPASALLSSVLLKAGVIGWLRFFPQALESLAVGALAIMAAGLAAALLGAVAGVLQRNPKMLLAYSSISQMGLLTAAFGMAVSDPLLWRAMIPLLGLFACHHALVKAALFLSVGVDRHQHGGNIVRPLLLLLGLALAGAPLTGGALVKMTLEGYLSQLSGPAAEMFELLLPATSAASTVLMLRFVHLMRGPVPAAKGAGGALASPGAFVALSVIALLGPWLLAWSTLDEAVQTALEPGALWKSFWPVALGSLIALSLLRYPLRWVLPPGDIALPLERWVSVVGQLRLPPWQRPRVRLPPAPWPGLERKLRRMPITGIAYFLCLLAFALVGGVR